MTSIRQRILAAVLGTAIVLPVGGCSTWSKPQSRTKGTVIGATAGALIGGKTGAVIGAAAGNTVQGVRRSKNKTH